MLQQGLQRYTEADQDRYENTIKYMKKFEDGDLRLGSVLHNSRLGQWGSAQWRSRELQYTLKI